MLEVELIQINGNDESARHRVRGKKFLVGRHKMCHLRLSDDSVSKTHCVIIKHRNQVLVTDLGSRLGTKVNGNVVCLAETAPLQHDDRIQLGESEFLLSVTDTATGEPVYCDPAYVDSLPYPFVCPPNRRTLAKKPSTKKPSTKKPSTKEPSTKEEHVAIEATASAFESDSDDHEFADPSDSLPSDSLPSDSLTSDSLTSDSLPSREIQFHDVDDEAPSESDSDDSDRMAPSVANSDDAEPEQDTLDQAELERLASKKRIEEVRQKILANNGSSNAASDALQRMFPGRKE